MTKTEKKKPAGLKPKQGKQHPVWLPLDLDDAFRAAALANEMTLAQAWRRAATLFVEEARRA